MTENNPAEKASDRRDALELAQTAKARFETTELAVKKYGLDLERVVILGDQVLDHIYAGDQQNNVLWVMEIAVAMITAVMAVKGEPLPISQQVDPASFAVSVLRDLAVDAQAKGMDWDRLETTAAEVLRDSEKSGYSDVEAYWALNRATAKLELAWAGEMAQEGETKN